MNDQTRPRPGSETPDDYAGSSQNPDAHQIALLARVMAERSQLEAILQQMPAGVVIAEAPSEAPLLINQQAKDLTRFGYDQVPQIEQYMHMQPFRGLRPDGSELQAADWPLARALRQGEIVTSEEIALVYSDGSVVTIQANAAPIRNASGEIIAGVTTFTDISPQKVAEARQVRLQKLTAKLAEALTVQQIADAIIEQGLVTVGADSAVIAVQSLQADTAPEILKSLGDTTIALGLNAAKPLSGPTNLTHSSLIAQIVQSGKPLWLESETEIRSSYPELTLPEHFAGAWVGLPLIGQQKVLGALCLGFSAPGRFGASERKFIESMAGQCTQALERAYLYEAEQAARVRVEHALDRIGRLQAITAKLSQVLTSAECAQVVIDGGAASVGALTGTITLLRSAEASMEIIGTTGYSQQELAALEAWRVFPLSVVTPMADAARENRAIWIESREAWRQEYPHLAADLDKIVHSARALVPLVLDTRVLGTLGLAFGEPRQFTDEDRTFIYSLAQLCAQALERAQLYAEVMSHARTLEHKVAERTEAMQEALARAQESDRVRSAMLLNVSHELRTPLSSIIGYSDLILNRQLDADKLKTYSQVINSEGRRLSTLVNDFLDLQRVEERRGEFKFQRVNLVTLVQQVVESQEASITRQGPQVVVEAPEALFVWADRKRIEQVILNLFSNAQKYAPASPTITIRLWQQGESANFSIRDHGIGLRPDEINEVFGRFYRSEAADRLRIQGTGLGLALCKEIISAHGGRIWAESPGPQLGSTFTFALPLAEADSVELNTFASQGEQGALSVLLADDSDTARQLLKDIFVSAGFNVVTAKNGQDVIQQLMQDWPDVIILDLAMPDVDGFAVLNWIRHEQHNRNVPVIAFATAHLTDLQRQILEKSANAIAIKSMISPQNLLKLVHQVIAHPNNRKSTHEY